LSQRKISDKIPKLNQHPMLGTEFGTSAVDVGSIYSRLDLRQREPNSSKLCLAEQHAVPWLVGVICGVRNGILAENANKLNTCVIDITRELSDVGDEWDGNFTIVVKFKYRKGRKKKRVKKVLPLTIKSSKLEKDLPPRLPHRVLVVLHRRGYLEDHAFESLFNGQ
jgi:hypothetical protein